MYIQRRTPIVLVKWIISFLSDRTQTVTINEARSKLYSVTSGVPQGSVLGPLLFILYTDDIDQVIDKNVTIRKYADDIKLYCMYEASEATAGYAALQRSLDNVAQWSLKNYLPLNIRKCCSMHFGSKSPAMSFSIGPVNLSISNCERDLGVQIDNKLSFKQHIRNVTSKA